MSRTLARAASVADRRVTGLALQVLADPVTELGPRWQARQDARLADRPRRRAIGAGARYRLVFLDRLRALSRHHGRREHLETILPAVAGLVSSQERAPRPDPLHRPPRVLPAGTTA